MHNTAKLYYISKSKKVNKKVTTVTDNHESIKDSYKYISRSNNTSLSAQDKQILDLLRQLTAKKGYAIINYSWVMEQKLGKSLSTVKRTFKYLSNLFTCEYHKALLVDGKKQHCKVLVTRTSQCNEILENAYKKLENKRSKMTTQLSKNGRSSVQKWTVPYKGIENTLEGITELPKEAQVIPQREINKEKGKNDELAFEHFEGAQANSHEIKENDKTCLTAKQEKDYYALHQSRNSSTEPETGFNTIMDTIANLKLPTENRKESIKTIENLQKMEDLQPKVENSSQISWHAVKKILSTKQKFYRLDNVVVTESLRKITISHQYTSALDLIDRDLGIHLKNIAEEFNIQIILLNQQDTEVVRYDPGKQKYEVTADDLKYMKSLKGNEYSAVASSPFPELVERLEEFIANNKIEKVWNNNLEESND